MPNGRGLKRRRSVDDSGDENTDNAVGYNQFIRHYSINVGLCEVPVEFNRRIHVTLDSDDTMVATSIEDAIVGESATVAEAEDEDENQTAANLQSVPEAHVSQENMLCETTPSILTIDFVRFIPPPKAESFMTTSAARDEFQKIGALPISVLREKYTFHGDLG